MKASARSGMVIMVGAAILATTLVALHLPGGGHAPPEAAPRSAAFGLGPLLGGTSVEGYARAVAPRAFSFPADHGPHPHFRSEWWYFTGNLLDGEDRRFGYQWTLFRFALRPRANERRSAWATHQIYMAHLAVTDVRDGRFIARERLTRGALDLAGAQASAVSLWIEDWRATRAQASGQWRLQARDDGVALDLHLTPVKPVVLQGDAGLSRKGAAPGNASYYYSLPRLATRGTVTLHGKSFPVQGESWLDREWSTSALEQGQIGWDWFGLQFDDRTELMVYRMRRRDGGVDPHSSGTFIDQAGQSRTLRPDEVALRVLDDWQSPGGGRYPARWQLSVRPLGLTLEVRPVLADQRLDLSVVYWEGAVTVSGERHGAPLTGRGYVELTGYE
jgi:predicted secreted hydrolase